MSRAIFISLGILVSGSLYAETEQLLAAAPEAWKVTNTKQYTSMRIVELVPPDSNTSSWAEKLSIESFSTNPLPDPIQLLDTKQQNLKYECEQLESRVTYSGYENNYPTSIRLFNCNRDKLTQMQKILLVKAILGNEHVYIVSREMRLGKQQENISPEVIQKTVARWSTYLSTISVCDSSHQQHPCPG